MSFFNLIALGIVAPITLFSVSTIFMDKPSKPHFDPVYVDTEWGFVERLDFLYHSRSGAYFTVKTDQHFFDKMDITDFPGDKIAIGDRISYRLSLTPYLATELLCKNHDCRIFSLCHDTMPCFSQHKEQVYASFYQYQSPTRTTTTKRERREERIPR